ncbi:hypothetical protein NESM_000223900 [Novymonas esmeraldas]|uniref:Cilia- and flagella-associated protein 206 n=1 Tax=Novymonas esmeraldas TaxID=1808958 RepID=A0AAW0F4V9_9TRYP
MKKASPAAAAAADAAAASLLSVEDVWERLWCALPSVQEEQRRLSAETPPPPQDDVAGASQRRTTEEHLRTDVHRESTAAAAAPALLSVSLPRSEMVHLVSCVYLALHANAIDADVEAAVGEVLHGASVSGASAAALQEAYTREDVFAFLESVPGRWVPDVAPLQDEDEDKHFLVEFNVELVDCIVDDEAPHRLLQATEVLTVQRTAAAVYLGAPVADYVELLPARSYPAVYDTLMEKLQLEEQSSGDGLTLSQFRIFLGWFHGLHFNNTNAPRSSAAAEDVYNRYCDATGRLTATQFELACEELCAVYAQRRDAADYLEHLVRRTEHALSQSNSNGGAQATACVQAEFFLHPEEVMLPSWRRELTSPVTLYLPDELRAVQQEAARYHCHSSPRLLLLGPLGIGKREVGRQLAAELHCVHLDVLDLAIAELNSAEKGELAAELATCLAERAPVPMAVQVQLLQRAMTSARAEYRGYVLSDTLSATPQTVDAVNESFVRPLKLASLARPDHVVEVCTAVSDVYAERALGRIGAAAAASQRAWDVFTEAEAAAAAAAEKAQMRADCAKIMARLVELEGATGKAAPPAAELELARQQAVEAEGILQALDEEDGAGGDGGEDDDDDAEGAGVGKGSSSTPPPLDAVQQAAEVRLRLAALILDGRVAAGVLPASFAADGAIAAATDAVPTLEEQDWTSCWRKHVDLAKALNRHVLVDPIASASAAEVTAFLARVFRLSPCDEATALGTAKAGEDEEAGGDDDDGAREPASSSVAADEERSREVEEAAQEAGLSLSLVWKRYCPVTALEDQVLLEGAACYACSYRGSYYCFASVAKRNAFMDHPARYLRQRYSPHRTPVLVLADDALVHDSPAIVDAVGEVVGAVATRLNLTPYAVSTYAKLLEPRQALLQARHTRRVERQKVEEGTRKTRAERQEMAAKALAKKSKGKVEPTKPKAKRPAGANGRASVLQSSQQGGAGARRRLPRAMVVEGPHSMADEKAVKIRAAQEKAAHTAPVLLSAVTPADLNADLLRSLWDGNLLPETVLVLRHPGAPALAATDDADEEDEEAEKGEAAVAAAGGEQPGAVSVLTQVVGLLKKGPKSEWRSAMAGRGSPIPPPPQPFTILSITVPEAPVVREVVAEVMQQLDPLAIQVAEAAVDEALGEEDENAADEEEAEEEEEAALLNPDGEAAPAVPRPPRHPLTRPMRRFLHQFGSRLDYCPVTLHERGILVRGRQEFCLRFVDGLYVFATQEARDAFTRCPQRYVGELPPETLPPRVWLVGTTNSGKKSLAAGLQEAYRVPYFVYDRQFFEECVEAALTPGGGMVRGVYVPQDSPETNTYVRRAHMLLEEVRSKATEETAKLKARAEAERLLQEREQREEERAARSNPESDEEEEDGGAAADGWDEAKEAELQEKLEFEPEDPEDKQVRLSEAYLRIASCVTRFRPFDTLGYVMICPPFSDGDLDVLFDEGGIPEVVMRLNVDEEVFAQRGALRAAQRRASVQRARELNVAAKAAEAAKMTTQTARDAARLQRRREKALRKWRRRHIGVNDVDSPSDAEGEADAEASPAEAGSGAAGGYANGNMDAAADGGDGQPGMDEDRHAQEEALDEFMGGVEERLVEVVQINGAAAKETVRRAVVEALGRHMRNRASLFYVPEVMRYDDAKARLLAGGCDLSSFGFEDPVRLYGYRQEGRRAACAWKPVGARVGPEEGAEEMASGRGGFFTAADAEDEGNEKEAEEAEELSEVASDEVQELRDVVERRKRRRQREAAPRAARVHRRLYFFEDDDSLLRFVRDPWPYMRQPPPNPTLLQRPVVSVYEQDDRYATEHAGEKERLLADSVAFNLRVKCVSATSLLAWGAVHPHWHSLKLDCMLAAQQGILDPHLVHKLLTLYLSSAEAKGRGAVLHNLPSTTDSAEALPRVACATPIVKVIKTTPPREVDVDGAALEAVVEAAAASVLERHAAVHLALPRPSVPLDASNLVAAVHGVEEHVLRAEEALLRDRRAFPACLSESYQVYSYVHRHLSEYGAYCPYEWLEHDDLVRSVQAPTTTAAAAAEVAESDAAVSPFSAPATNEVELRWGAAYLGQYFFFSSADYLHRFLRDPTTVTDPATAKPMPRHFPVVVTSPVAESALALEGCCPVLLYDTRERRGLRCVVQPTAKKGSAECVVEYDGSLYALLDLASTARFMRRPWQYVAGACLPRLLRRPLPTGTAPSAIVDHEEYIQRQLYDPVARALLAVARERPIYPGLSVEESALKYMALFLKAHRDPATVSAFEDETYRHHFDTYRQRAALYRTAPSTAPEAASTTSTPSLTPPVKSLQASATGGDAASPRLAVASALAASNREFCTTFNSSLADARDMRRFNRLPHPADAAS